MADASVLGVLIEMENDIQLEENSWISVQGELQVSTHNGRNVVSIKVIHWKETDHPKDPYIYPGKNQ